MKKREKTLNIKNTNQNHNFQTSITEKKYVAIVYYKNITERIENIFRNETNIKLAPKPFHTLNKKIFTNAKQEIPNKDKSNVIYKIKCTDCDSSYIGQTKNYLQNRVNCHKNDVKNGQQKTALATHAIQKLHKFNFNDVEILRQEQNLNKRLFIEMAEILNCKTVNFNTDISNLPNIYYNIIKN